MRVVLRTIVAIQVVDSETLKPSPIDSLGEQPEEFEEEPRRARARLGQSCNQGALMGISVSLVFIAVGAILKWAVTATVSGVDLGNVGVVRMIVGVVGLLLSLVFWSSWGGFGARGRSSTTVVRDEPTTLR